MQDGKHLKSHIEFIVLWITMIIGFYLMNEKIERSISKQSAHTDKLYEIFIKKGKK
jgi:hypothetical protein